MTPLPDHLKAKPSIEPAPVLAHYLAQHVEGFIWRGHRQSTAKAKLFLGIDQHTISFQAERALRMRLNDVTYTATGHPLRRVDHKPGRGEYCVKDEVLTISEADIGEQLTIRTPSQ